MNKLTIHIITIIMITGIILLSGCCSDKNKKADISKLKKKKLKMIKSYNFSVYSDQTGAKVYFLPSKGLEWFKDINQIRNTYSEYEVGITPVDGFKTPHPKGTLVLIKDDFYPEYAEIDLIENDSLIKNVKLIQKAKGMVFVKNGSLIIGKGLSDTQSVKINSFYIKTSEVTIKDYQLFCDDKETMYPDKKYEKICKHTSNVSNSQLPEIEFSSGNRLDSPVTFVAWYDAIEYCNWLSLRDMLNPCYTIKKKEEDLSNKNLEDYLKWIVKCDFSANGYRLPTELEWEYSAQGGGNGKGYAYSGSDIPDEAGWYDNNSLLTIHPIKYKIKNEIDLFDMSGNASEWCWDWYEADYSGNSPEQGEFKSVRGGGWKSKVNMLLSVSRSGKSPHVEDIEIGFRLVRTYK